jgi:uncharacterized protein (TIGR02453 family)
MQDSRFMGFPSEGIGFFKGLETNNNREWFQAHKDVYERACREPMKDLMAEFEPTLGRSKISRINRDIRFSSDRSPYKTYLAAGVGRYYISLSSAGLYVGTGMYRPDPTTLTRLRSAIDTDASGRKLHTLVTSLRRKGYHVDTHDSVPSAPRGYSAGHPRIELLRMKDMFAGKVLAPGPWLSSRKALDRVKRVMTDIKPFKDWIHRHVG